MTVVPFLVNQLLGELGRADMYDPKIGIPMSLDHQNLKTYERVLSVPFRGTFVRRWHKEDTGVSCVMNDKNGFKIILDVQQFKAEELTVKIVENYVCIEGKHEERFDKHGYVSRHFTRRYKLPKSVDKQALKSDLSSDGVLQLYGPNLPEEGVKEWSIPITQTNKPAVKSTDANNKKES